MSSPVNRGFRTLFAFMVVAALALGVAVGPAYAATAEGFCGGLGGTWDGLGGSSDTGICYLPAGYGGVDCPGMDYVGYAFDAGVTVAVGCTDVIDVNDQSGFALVGSMGGDCIEEGGLWDGDLGSNGTCTFPDGNAIAFSNCGTGYDVVFTIIGGGIADIACAIAGSGGGGSDARVPGFGQFGSTTNHNDGGGTLDMSGGKNGSVTFDAGTCLGKCTLGPNLPGGAHADLPDDAVAWLYFKSVDENGDPGTGTYTVCFNVGDLTSPVIYRYVSGAWVAVSATVSGGQVCTTASGDGAFALGGS